MDTTDGRSLADTLGKSLGVPSVGVPGCHLVILEGPHLRFGVLCFGASAIEGKPKKIRI